MEVGTGQRRFLSKSVPTLDVIRGVAISLVVVSHLHWILSVDPNYSDITPWHFLNVFISRGFLGVDLFFVLSGFLITSNLIRRRSSGGRTSLTEFYLDRLFRLFPALCALLMTSIAVAWWERFPRQYQWNSTWRALLFISNWNYQQIFLRTQDDIGHLWSLAVEGQFYIVWPILFVVACGRSFNIRRLSYSTGLLVLAVVLRRIQLWKSGEPWLFIYPRTDARVDAILIGCLFAVAYGYMDLRRLRNKPTVLAATSLWLVIAYFFADPSRSFLYLGGFTALSILSGTIILCLALEDPQGGSNLIVRILRWLGRKSYGLYLWHLLVFRFVARHLNSSSELLAIGIALITSLGLAQISFSLIERPALKVKRRLLRKFEVVAEQSRPGSVEA